LRKSIALSKTGNYRALTDAAQTTHILFIGGLGCHSDQARFVAKVLSDHYGQRVVGVSFSEAQKNLTDIARLSRDCIVITHGSGLVLCEDLTPKELIAIAPSLPATIPIMVWRCALKSAALTRSAGVSALRAYKIRAYHRSAVKEHIIRLRYNSGQMGRIATFDPAKLAVKMIHRRVRVTLGFMSRDFLYPRSAHHVHVDMARRHGAEVHDDIKGHHDEFMLYPLDILAQLNRF
jgi:hypothetical protein